MEVKKYKDTQNSKNIFGYNILDKNIKKYLSSWLKYLELEKGFSKNTVLAYEKDLRKFLNFFCWHKNNKNMDLSNLSENNLRKIKEVDFDYKNLSLTKNELIDIKYNEIRPFLFFITFLNYKKTSRKRIIASIKSFYNFLSKNEENIDLSIINELKGPKLDQSLPRPIDFKNIKEIINEINNIKNDNWIKKRNMALISIIYGCGLRVNEALSIKFKDIPKNTSKGYIKIFGKGNKERIVPLIIYVMEKINEYISLTVKLAIAFGLAFQLPTAIFLFTLLGITSPRDLQKKRRFVIVIIFLISALITPPDIISQIGLAVPVIFIYEFSI